jgi:hypothetical protein
MIPGVQPVGFIAHEDNDIITGLHYLPFNATAAPKSGDAVRAFGYPMDAGTPGSMRLVCAETIVTTLADGFIKTDSTNVAASGFSGGPMVNSTGEVVGVMSKDRNTRHNKGQTVNVSCFRQLSGQIHDEHQMPTDADLRHLQLQVCQPDKLHQVEQGLAAVVDKGVAKLVESSLARQAALSHTVAEGNRENYLVQARVAEARAANEERIAQVYREAGGAGAVGVGASGSGSGAGAEVPADGAAAVLETQREQVGVKYCMSQTAGVTHCTHTHTHYPAGMAYCRGGQSAGRRNTCVVRECTERKAG